MRIAVLGTGQVGQAVASRLVDVGHEVRMGSRTAGNEKAVAWAQAAGGSEGTFAYAAAYGEVVVNATGGLVAVEALTAAGADNLAGKPLLDISNGLDFSGGFPPTIVQPEGRSVAESIQAAFPDARVVKTLNTVNVSVMVNPRSLPESTTTFLAGDHDDAKSAARGLLHDIGWEDDEILDLGGLAAARGLEQYLSLWLSTMQRLGTAEFNVRVVRG